MKRSEKRRENIKTLIIATLFLIVILMVCLHFVALRKRNDNAVSNDPTNDFTLKSNFSSSENSSEGSMLLPSEIAFKDDTGNTYAISSGKDYMKEIYSLLEPDILYMLGTGCSANDESESAFENAVSSNGFIYLRYHTSLPAALLYINAIEGNSIKNTTIDEKTASLSVKELVIFPDSTEEGSVFALSRSSSGKVTKFISEKRPDSKNAGIADLEIYREAGAMLSAEFYGGGAENKILGSTLIFDDVSTKPALNITSGIDTLSENAELQSKFAELLAINPNKTGNYFDSEIGGTIYMATHGTLTFTDGSIIYSTENNTDGIALSHFSGKEKSTEHSIYECLSVSQALANAFSEKNAADIGEAEMLITDLYRTGDKLTVNFGYFYDNIPISELGSAFSVELTSSTLLSLKFYPASIEPDKTELKKALPASWILGITEGSERSDVKYTLTYKYVKNHDGTYNAEWIPAKLKSQ